MTWVLLLFIAILIGYFIISVEEIERKEKIKKNIDISRNSLEEISLEEISLEKISCDCSFLQNHQFKFKDYHHIRDTTTTQLLFEVVSCCNVSSEEIEKVILSNIKKYFHIYRTNSVKIAGLNNIGKIYFFNVVVNGVKNAKLPSKLRQEDD